MRTIKNQPQIAKISQNHPKPATTTQNQSQPVKRSQNQPTSSKTSRNHLKPLKISQANPQIPGIYNPNFLQVIF